MKKPEYKFQLKKVISNDSLNLQNKGQVLDDGTVDYDAPTSNALWLTHTPQQCKDLAGKEGGLYFDVDFTIDRVNWIFFYASSDASDGWFSRRDLKEYNRQIIQVPEAARSYLLQLRNAEPDFYKKVIRRKENFIQVDFDCAPHYKSLSKKLTREPGQEFFRETLDGGLTLFGKDFDLINDMSLEDYFVFLLQKKDSAGVFADYFRGRVNKTDCKLDSAKQKCELNVQPLDDYTNILDKWENTYDLIKLAPALSEIEIYKRGLIQIYISGESVVSNFCAGTYWETSVEPVSDHDKLLSSHFQLIKVATEFTLYDEALPEDKEGAVGTYAGCLTKSGNAWEGTYQFKNNSYSCVIDNSGDSPQLSFRDFFGNAFAVSAYVGGVLNPDNGALKFTGYVLDTAAKRVAEVDSVFNNYVYARILTDNGSYPLAPDDFAAANSNYNKCEPGDTSLASVYASARTVSEPTRFGKNSLGTGYFTNDGIIQSLNRLFPIGRSSWAKSSIWFSYFSVYKQKDEATRKAYLLKDAWSIGAVIKALLKETAPELSFGETAEYSQFLFGPTTLPAALHHRFYIYITPKTNILKGEYDQPAQKAETTLKNILDMLCKCFRCYWFIEGGKLRIEHIYYFLNGGSYETRGGATIDATGLTDAMNGQPILYFQSELSYDKSDLPGRYEFGWADDCTELFDDFTLDIQSSYVQKDKKEDVTPSSFSSDVDYMLANPEAFSNDGFALLCPIRALSNYALNWDYIPGQAWLDSQLRTGNQFNMQRREVTSGDSYQLRIQSSGGFDYCVSMLNSSKSSVRVIRATAGYTSIYETRIDVQSGEKYIVVSYNRFSESSPTTYPATLKSYNGQLLPIESQLLRDESDKVYEATIQNGYASWIYLYRYYLYDLPAARGEMSKYSGEGSEISALGVKRCMEQEIRLPMEEDPAITDLIKTASGKGSIEEYSVDIDTRVADVTLRFEPK